MKGSVFLVCSLVSGLIGGGCSQEQVKAPASAAITASSSYDFVHGLSATEQQTLWNSVRALRLTEVFTAKSLPEGTPANASFGDLEKHLGMNLANFTRRDYEAGTEQLAAGTSEKRVALALTDPVLKPVYSGNAGDSGRSCSSLHDEILQQFGAVATNTAKAVQKARSGPIPSNGTTKYPIKGSGIGVYSMGGSRQSVSIYAPLYPGDLINFPLRSAASSTSQERTNLGIDYTWDCFKYDMGPFSYPIPEEVMPVGAS